MYFITVMAKLNVHQLLLQSSVSHDSSETFLIIINNNKSCFLNIFVETVMHFFQNDVIVQKNCIF